MAEKKVVDWFTLNGNHIPIYEGESKQDAVNRSIAKDNEEKKQSDIAKNKKEADKLNGKGETPEVLNKKDSMEVSNLLKSKFDEAQAQGYEIIPRKYTERGKSGKVYDLTESRMLVPVKDGKISKSSTFWKHYMDTKGQYDDVIYLQTKGILDHHKKQRGRIVKDGYDTEFVVMARKSK